MGSKPSSTELREKVVEIQRKSAEIRPRTKFRIVVCARGKDGKSSSINNLLSALEGEYSQPANVGSQHNHVTQKYIEYKMLIGEAQDTSYVICDTPGLRDGISEDQQHAQTEVLKAAILGKFQSTEEVTYMKLAAEDLDKRNIKNERAVCVIFVIDVRKVLNGVIETSQAFQSMKDILDFAQHQNIAVSCLLTNCDEVDGDVKKDMTKIYSSLKIEEARQLLEKKFCGFPGNRIFPIVNYTEIMHVNNDMMVQSLFALKNIMSDILSNLRKKVSDSIC